MKVAYIILNSFEFDSRARLEVETIGKMGHRVEIIAAAGGDSDNYLGFPIHRIKQHTWPTRKIRFPQFNFRAAMIGAGIGADVYHAVDLDVLSGAFWAAKKAGGRLIYEARELYTELEPLNGRNTLKAIWRGVERRLIGKADRVITINESIAAELCARYGIEKPEIIRNVASKPGELKSIDLRARFSIAEDKRIVLYQGVLRKGQGLEYQLEIARHLEDVVMVFLGTGPIEEELRRMAAKLGAEDKIIFAGRVPPEEVMNYTVSADAGILLMEDSALNNRLALPQKLFQYLCAGIPQIVSPMPEISGFVTGEDTGIVVPPGDPRQAAELISGLFRDKNRYEEIRNNCKISAERNNWEKESEKLVEIYRQLEGEND
jgi:glycosyltransferase involved in cell wall biosynthesis